MVKKITLKDKIDESREFAQDVDASLYDGLQKGNAGLKNRGVKKAPFVVLIGANMPSILTEISFVTNPQDAAEAAHRRLSPARRGIHLPRRRPLRPGPWRHARCNNGQSANSHAVALPALRQKIAQPASAATRSRRPSFR